MENLVMMLNSGMLSWLRNDVVNEAILKVSGDNIEFHLYTNKGALSCNIKNQGLEDGFYFISRAESLFKASKVESVELKAEQLLVKSKSQNFKVKMSKFSYIPSRYENLQNSYALAQESGVITIQMKDSFKLSKLFSLCRLSPSDRSVFFEPNCTLNRCKTPIKTQGLKETIYLKSCFVELVESFSYNKNSHLVSTETKHYKAVFANMLSDEKFYQYKD